MADATELDRLMDNVRIRLPGAVDSVIRLEIFNVMDDFFQRSNSWTEDVTFTTDPGVTEYDVTCGPGNPNRLMYVVNADGIAQAATFELPGTLVIASAPTEAEEWTARIAMTVRDPIGRDGVPYFPDWILSKYGTDLIDGVLGRMMSQVAKPYSNMQMAQFHSKRFGSVVNQAKVEAMHKNVYRGQTWRFPQNFTRRRPR